MAFFEASSHAFSGRFDGAQVPARVTLTTNSIGADATVDAPAFLDFMRRVVDQQLDYVSVIDLRSFGLPSVATAKELGDWCHNHYGDFKRIHKAIAIMLHDNFMSMASRWMINLVLTLAPAECPILICHSEEAAEAFFVQHVGEATVRPGCEASAPAASSTTSGRAARARPSFRTVSCTSGVNWRDCARLPGRGGTAAAAPGNAAGRARVQYVDAELRADSEAFEAAGPSPDDQGRAMELSIFLANLTPEMPAAPGWHSARSYFSNCCASRPTPAGTWTPVGGADFSLEPPRTYN